MSLDARPDLGADATAHELVTDDPERLRAILLPDVNVVVCRRRLAPWLASSLADAVATNDLDLEVVLERDAPAVLRLAAPLDLGASRDAFVLDLALLAGRFFALTGSRRVKATLAVVADDKCRKLHVDNVALRLVCTYVGPGTEWAPEAAVNRAAMVSPHPVPAIANAEIVPEARRIRRACAGDIVLLKGRRFAPSARGGVHRSPPLEGTGARRLVLALTSPEAP